MKFMKKNLWAIVFIVMLTIVPIFAFADNHTGGNTPPPPTPTGGNDPAKIKNPLGETKTVEEVMEKLLVGVIKIGIPIVALAIIYSGFLFVKAQGNPEELTKAKEALLYSLIGAAVLLGAWAITKVVFDTVKSLAS